MHGDRLFGDDPAIVGGIGLIDGRSVMIIGHQKGCDTQTNIYRNFGMPIPKATEKLSDLCVLPNNLICRLLHLLTPPEHSRGSELKKEDKARQLQRNLAEMSA